MTRSETDGDRRQQRILHNRQACASTLCARLNRGTSQRRGSSSSQASPTPWEWNSANSLAMPEAGSTYPWNAKPTVSLSLAAHPTTTVRVDVTVPLPAWAAEPIDRDVELVGLGWRRQLHWHEPTRLGSAAFWIDQTRQRPRPETYQVGAALHEEVALCLLGGYGVTEAMALGAFRAIRAAGLLDLRRDLDQSQFEEVLRRPYRARGHAGLVHYRFPNQRAERLAIAARFLATQSPPPEVQPRQLRDWLTQLPGVGPKTASWIVRNTTRSDDVAIIDIHVRRAGIVAGVFDPGWTLPRDYAAFEQAFCAWARLGRVPTADLDACIWSSLATLGGGARALFGVDRLSELDTPTRTVPRTARMSPAAARLAFGD